MNYQQVSDPQDIAEPLFDSIEFNNYLIWLDHRLEDNPSNKELLDSIQYSRELALMRQRIAAIDNYDRNLRSE